MNPLLNEINKTLCELRSEKVQTRHKAAEFLDQKLTNSKSDLFDLLEKTSASETELSWTLILQSAVDATIKHATKTDETSDKSYQTMVNKNHTYNTIITKLIEYNLEANSQFFAKNIIVKAFIDGMSTRSSVKYFGLLFLKVLDRGVYKSPTYVRELKVNEYSRILSYLFEINDGGDNHLRFGVLRTIANTVELAHTHVQINTDLVEYLHEMLAYSKEANNDQRKADVVRLCYYFLAELSIDYHKTICEFIQNILPLLCTFYDEKNMRNETKIMLFQSIIMALYAIYPNIENGDFNTINASLQDDWPKTIRKIRTMIEVEIRSFSLSRVKASLLATDKFVEHFIKIAALINYINYWHLDYNSDNQREETPSKISKPDDKLNIVIDLIQKKGSNFNEIWFSIFAELISKRFGILNASNIQEALQITFNILQISNNGYNFRNVRLCVVAILGKESELIAMQSISKEFLNDFWIRFFDHIIADTSSIIAEVIAEKQLIFQALISHNKLSATQCSTLLHNITTNSILKRNECLSTIRLIFQHAEQCAGMDKATLEMERLLSWAYGTAKKINVTKAIHNVAPLDAALLADTFAICVINFIDEEILDNAHQKQNQINNAANNLQLLSYKYNRMFICIAEQDQYFCKQEASKRVSNKTKQSSKNCLFQNNYEMLMRQLNYDTTNKTEHNDILTDLTSLHKMACLMERFLHYKIFYKENLTSCPLIKRIGFFFNHLEFQLKSINLAAMEATDLLEILLQLELILKILTNNDILLDYMENQILNELNTFVIKSIAIGSRNKTLDHSDWKNVMSVSVRVLSLLCAIRTCVKCALERIIEYDSSINSIDILKIISMFCSFKNIQADIAKWIVNKLKNIFRLYHAHIEIIDNIVDQLPDIFAYVYLFDEQLQNMLIALISLMKIAFKKSYSTKLTVKIIKSVCVISQSCPDIYKQENFANICLSVAKFLAFPSLQIQYATITTLTALMNLNWMVASHSSENCESHLSFCEKIYEQIEWKNLEINTDDKLQNSISAIVQLLVSFFVFSSFHQEMALQELVHFCALRKLTEVEFNAFRQSIQFYGVTIRQLTRPYINNLLQKWIIKSYPISKFPYFLCCDSKEIFFKEHSAIIKSYILIFGNVADIKRLANITGDKTITEESEQFVHAFLLTNKCRCDESDEVKDHKQFNENMEKLQSNINLSAIEVNGITLYTIAKLYRDPTGMRQLFDLSLSLEPIQWFNIGKETLRETLNFYVCKKRSHYSGNNEIMLELISKHSLKLIQMFSALKANCCDCYFAVDKLKYFFIYCTLAEMVIEFMDNIDDLEDAYQKNCCKYFVRDIIFFLLNFLVSTNICEVQKAVLKALNLFINKPGLSTEFSNDFIKTYLNEIIKPIMLCCTQNSSIDVEIGELTVKTISAIILQRREHLADAVSLIDEFPSNELFENLSCLQACKDNDQTNAITQFLHTKNRGIGGLQALRQYLSNNKTSIQINDTDHYELIRCLIDIVRNSDKMECRLDAAKCLGEIGPLKINNISYYFPTDDFSLKSNMNMNEVKDPLKQFIDAMCQTLEKQLLQFNSKTHQVLFEVAQHIVNSQCEGESIIDSYPNLQVFSANENAFSDCNTYDKIESIDWLDILRRNETLDYEHWICAFMSCVFKSCDWKAFADYAAMQTSFAEDCLQPFVNLLLANKEKHLDGLCQMLEYFFEGYVESTINPLTLNEKLIFKEKRAISRLLSICENIRMRNDWEVPITLSNVIKASNHCQAYFMSVMYLELWGYKVKNTKTTNSPPMDVKLDDNFQEYAKQAYEAIGCTDDMTGFLNPLHSRLDYFNMENNFSDILLEINASNSQQSDIYTEILKRNGMLTLAGLQQQHNKIIDYEIYWLLGQWDMPVEGHTKVNTLNDMEHEFKKHHYMALKSIYNREENNGLSAISHAHECVISILREISIECLQSVYKYLTWLKMLHQAEDFCKIQFSTSSSVNEVFNKCRTELELEYGSFKCKEYLLSHQIALFKTAGVRANRKITDFYKDNPIELYLLKSIRECKKAGEINLAKRNIVTLQAMPSIKIQTKISVMLEDADVCLKTGKLQMTNAILQDVIKNTEYLYCPERVGAFRMQGKHLIESNAENFETVLRKYFNVSLEYLGNYDKNKEVLKQKFPNVFKWDEFESFKNENRQKTYEVIAKYADREYKQLNNYLNSSEYQTRLNIIQQNRLTADSVSQSRDRDTALGARHLKSFATLDEKELQQQQERHSDYLCTAMEYYVNYCRLDDSFSSDIIYRIIALWFANKHNKKLQETIKDYIPSVPSYKFICALNQLTARLNSKNQDFLKVLVDLLVRCIRDHPHHTLYHIFPLIYASHDSGTSTPSSNGRVQIATDILRKARSHSNAECIKQLDALFPALIDFANVFVADSRKVKKITLSNKLCALKNLNAIQCPTIDLSVSPNGKYNVIGIEKWASDSSLVGGINAPKKLMCLCSDGQVRPQLLKGKDDLRQDAVMQQVFTFINELLKNEPEAVHRKLHLRTYKITPLSMRSGILEWCNDTIPIGIYLTGDGRNGAHKRYRPNDIVNMQCRTLAMQHLKSDYAKRYEIYKHICEKFKPVFHYFLLEKFPAPGIWFERRLAYTNSVATTSIVGYILGLGDRHSQNILIDEKTAEVVHIDFGIAFEQGKVMPTPETVPFRLTRDIVSPMGVCGTSGVFKKSCDVTMRILRRYQSVITTILEVLLYDPLYIWNIVPQHGGEGDEKDIDKKNLTAQRALLVVQNKLDGKEVGMLGFSNVEVQVQRLINEATSARNLCLLYPGWDPYL